MGATLILSPVLGLELGQPQSVGVAVSEVRQGSKREGLPPRRGADASKSLSYNLRMISLL